MSTPDFFDRVFATKLKKLLGVVIALVAAYIFGSLAIDSGSIALYIATMLSLVLAAKLMIRAAKSFF